MRGGQCVEFFMIPVCRILNCVNAGRGFFLGLMMTRNAVHLGGYCKKLNEIVMDLCRNRTIKKS